ncbi:WD domain, G-beta repeat protein [Dictyocaulus viviparus]|uniref:WD domain, G-beta repeat protein n=1 Tax=Dictyocaulus viviparus TaxID=29172 RepID=A0A0D8XYY5_DICVI|nr:WD domain, G-beta repeat protein [Dictyocaulus viviparus]
MDGLLEGDAYKSPLTSQSSIEDIAEDLDVSHEYLEEKQNSSKRKSPMDLTSQGKRYARSAMSRRCQRNALLHLISTCGLQHVRHVRQLIEPHFQKDFLSCLPIEKNRFSERVSGAWEQTAMGNGVTIVDHYKGAELEQHRRSRKENYGSVYSRSVWKATYLRRCRIAANWRRLPIGGSMVLRGHEEHVITCLQIQGDMLVTGSDDNTLRVWSIEKGKLLFSLVGHTGGVWTSQLSTDGKYIISGSTDRTVKNFKVWSARDGSLIHTLHGHTSTVRCMSLCRNILVSGSRDTTLRAWNIETGMCEQYLTGHVAAVRCVQFDLDNGRIVSGAYDFTIKVWDFETGICKYTLTGHTNRVYSLLLDARRNIVVSGSLDTTIRVWDIFDGTCISVLSGHHSLTSGMQLRGDILVSCNADSDVRVWNIRDGSCMYRLHGPNGHTSAITSLQFLDNGIVVTSGDDGAVKLWDVMKGEFIRDLVVLSSGGSGGCIWRLKATNNLLACAAGSRNGTEDTKIILLDFDAGYP